MCAYLGELGLVSKLASISYRGREGGGGGGGLLPTSQTRWQKIPQSLGQ